MASGQCTGQWSYRPFPLSQRALLTLLLYRLGKLVLFLFFVLGLSPPTLWLVLNLFMGTFDKIKFLILTHPDLPIFSFTVAAFWYL